MKAQDIYPEKQIKPFIAKEIERLNGSISRYITTDVFNELYDVFNSEMNIYLFDHHGDIRVISQSSDSEHINCAFDDQIESFAIAHCIKTANGYTLKHITYNPFY